LADKFVTVRKEHICMDDECSFRIIRKGERALVSNGKYFCVESLRRDGFPEDEIFGKKVKHQRQSNPLKEA
jgi:hypothetical protein